MKKLVTISTVILVISMLFKYGAEVYANRGEDYPEGPTVNIADIYIDIATSTFYTAEPFNTDNLFTGTVITFNEAGTLIVKAGVKEGNFHGPYTAWHDNGQERLSLIWKDGTHFKKFKAYHSNGDQVEGGNELGEKVFSGEIVLE